MAYAMRAKFGLSLSTRAVLFDWGTLDDLVEAARVAENSGYFESVWVGDNLLSKPRIEAIVTLSALAAYTEHMRLGTICLASFPLRDPILLALQWASLDVLSKGRTVLAVCNGASALEVARGSRLVFGRHHAPPHSVRTSGLGKPRLHRSCAVERDPLGVSRALRRYQCRCFCRALRNANRRSHCGGR